MVLASKQQSFSNNIDHHQQIIMAWHFQATTATPKFDNQQHPSINMGKAFGLNNNSKVYASFNVHHHQTIKTTTAIEFGKVLAASSQSANHIVQ